MAEKKERSNIPQEILDNYNKLMKNHSGIKRKEAAVPYTSLNGHMTSYLDKNGSIALRLPKETLDEFLENTIQAFARLTVLYKRNMLRYPMNCLKTQLNYNLILIRVLLM